MGMRSHLVHFNFGAAVSHGTAALIMRQTPKISNPVVIDASEPSANSFQLIRSPYQRSFHNSPRMGLSHFHVNQPRANTVRETHNLKSVIQ